MNFASLQFRAMLCPVILVVALAALAGVARGVAAGELLDGTAQGQATAGITLKNDVQLPLDVALTNENGNAVMLGEFFDGKKPVILMLVYFTCPNLCTEELNNLVKSLQDQEMSLRFGEQYSIITIGFGEHDGPALAKAKKANYLAALGRSSQPYSWHFLTGAPDQVKRIADTVGFGYVKNLANGQYLHGSAIFICTPAGRLSRTMLDTEYPPAELRDSLIDAADGRIGSTVLRMARICGLIAFKQGRYTWVAMRLMQAAGALTVLLMVALIGTWWLLEQRRLDRAGAVGPGKQPGPIG